MKRLFFIGFLAILFVACNNEEHNEDEHDHDHDQNTAENIKSTYSLNSDESILEWKGSMIGVYEHEGTLKFSESNITIENGQVVDGSFTIDMKSMLTTDDDALYVNAPREKLIGHLQADDFFAVESFPTSTFKVSSTKGNIIKGDLTIRGITNSEEVTDVTISEVDGVLTASGNLTFDRQKFDVKYENKMGDMVLSDDIELVISIKANSK